MLVITTGDIGTIEGAVSADLTGAASVEVNIKTPDRTVVTKTATIGDPAAGEWSISYAANDFVREGVYRLEVEVTFSSGEVQTFATVPSGAFIQFRARAQIA